MRYGTNETLFCGKCDELTINTELITVKEHVIGVTRVTCHRGGECSAKFRLVSVVARDESLF